MKKNILLFIIVALNTELTFAQKNTTSNGLGGSWEGNITQSDTSITYDMKMILYGKVGNIDYPSLSCGGTLEFVKTDGTTFWYKEHITFGKDKCIDGGLIQIRKHALGDDTYWDWRWEKDNVTVRGVVRGTGVEAK